MRLLLSGDVAPIAAMAVDEALLERGGEPTLRLYRWRPHGVSLGYFQRASELDLDRFAREGVPVVRRLTGGGAIYHGDEVTFSITAAESHPLFAGPVRASYERVHAILADPLVKCGAGAVAPTGAGRLRSDVAGSPWCFHESTPIDLAAASRKLVGSAQRRTRGRVLHHGSIVLRANRFTPEVASVGAAPEVVERALIEAFGARFDLKPGALTPEETARARALADERYANAAWTRRR